MREVLSRILLALLLTQPLLAQEQTDVPASEPKAAKEDKASKDAKVKKEANEEAAKAEENSGSVVDLNQIDLEQVEENWDSTSQTNSVGAVGADRNLQLKDIVQPTSDYSYASFGKPDPFSAPDLAAFRKGSAVPGTGGTEGVAGLDINGEVPKDVNGFNAEGKVIKISSPLQGYPLSALKIKGIWQLADMEIRALVQTPKNDGVIVKVGDPISAGKVLSIEKDRLTARLYKIRADGVREYEDQQLSVAGLGKVSRGVIKLEPGKEPQFLRPDDPEQPASPLGTADTQAVPQGGENLLTPRFPPAPAGAAPQAAAAAGIPNAAAGTVPAAAPAARPGGLPATPVALPGLAPAPTDAIPAAQDPRSVRPGSAR